MESMRVTPAGGDRFAIALRGHEIMVDQPADVGGTDIGPTPTELFVAGLSHASRSTPAASSPGTGCARTGSGSTPSGRWVTGGLLGWGA
jgi:hypothetical protein